MDGYWIQEKDGTEVGRFATEEECREAGFDPRFEGCEMGFVSLNLTDEQAEVLAEAEEIIRLAEARGFGVSDAGRAMVEGWSDEQVMGALFEGIIDGMTRLADGDDEGMVRSTYGVALLTREAITRGVM